MATKQEWIEFSNAFTGRKHQIAIMWLLFDEINLLRQNAGLPKRTLPQLFMAYKTKRDELEVILDPQEGGPL